MAVKGLGIDLVDVAELRKKLSGRAGKRFAENTFTEAEIACAKCGNVYKLATAFAAKEAVYKAFGTGWIEGKGVELVRHPETGAPSIRLHGDIKRIAKKRKIRKVLVSVSYTRAGAAAAAVISS